MTSTENKAKNLKIYSLTRLAFLCTLCYYCCRSAIQNVEAGGKGKVPIYMPIPIPIPVPASPPQGGKFAHQQRHQQQHQVAADDDEGEVKKIYLLQPVQKLHPQPQLKGGGFMGGPVQTHIHMPAPQVVAHQQQRQRHRATKQHSSSSHEADERPSSSFISNNKHQQQSELKILPIVVIPPIAPMPPIQLPPTNQAQSPRMTLTPQFNNYVVAASDRGYKKSHRIPSGGHNSLQDYKSFSDYNLAAASGSNYRDNQRLMMRSRMRRRHMRPGRGSTEGYGSQYGASRSARIRQLIDEDSIDDYDHNMRYTGQSSRVVPRYVSSGFGNNRRRQQQESDSGSARPRTSSSQNIRDQVFDQQQQSALFDDEPSSMAEPTQDSYSTINRDQQPRNSARGLRQFIDGSEMGLMNANSDLPRDVVGLTSQEVDRDYDDYNGGRQGNMEEGFDDRRTKTATALGQKQQQQQQRQVDLNSQDPDVPPGDYKRIVNHRGDLSTVYYERDSPDQSQYHNDASSARDGFKERRFQQPGGEREIFEDDEWRFDTIKSVAHSDPKANNTSTNSNSSQTAD